MLKAVEYLKKLRSDLFVVVREHPVELGLLLYLSVRLLIVYERPNCSIEQTPELFWGWVFAVLAYAVNTAVGHGVWRKVYYVSWLPIIPLSMLSGLGVWIQTSSGLITGLILTPVLFVLCHWAVDNRRFVFDGVIYLRAGVLSLLLSNLTFGLLLAILYSAAYIFGFEGVWLEHTTIWLSVVTEVLVVPLLFMIAVDRQQGAEFEGGRAFSAMLYYVMTPALLIYMSIFALYIVKILVLWSLPRGGVAYMVFGLTIFAFLLHAMRQLLSVKRYVWFFDRLGLFLLPFIVLFWAGAIRRVGEYGLTEPRVYLLACGVVMSVGAMLFLSKRYGRYLVLSIFAFVLFAALAYVPQLHPETLSQTVQPQECARERESIFLDRAATSEIYSFNHDTLRLYPDQPRLRFEISAAELLAHQLRAIGKNESQIPDLTDEEQQRMMSFRTDSLTITFSFMGLKPVDSLSYRIASLEVQCVVMER